MENQSDASRKIWHPSQHTRFSIDLELLPGNYFLLIKTEKAPGTDSLYKSRPALQRLDVIDGEYFC